MRVAVDRFKEALEATPDILKKGDEMRENLRDADNHLEGTYLVRLFAAFEAALRRMIEPAATTQRGMRLRQF